MARALGLGTLAQAFQSLAQQRLQRAVEEILDLGDGNVPDDRVAPFKQLAHVLESKRGGEF